MASKRSRGRVPNRYGPSVASDRRAGEVKVYDAATGELLRTEAPYRQYARNDPRRSRSGFDRGVYGNWNTARTPNPATTPADPSHPSADD